MIFKIKLQIVGKEASNNKFDITLFYDFYFVIVGFLLPPCPVNMNTKSPKKMKLHFTFKR
ncbi:CLUMA_CG008895, isoform A [Clunio marinus]|uniref:CLUMA_CG008895, isoform A n=1 Tax=Clunio marinus TaxID=568069 RepID=A0A1J1IA72_9DIPT|nr:CLUMA_CG008895, isoform A [Clunio marinus]